jgi:hypothetical protein
MVSMWGWLMVQSRWLVRKLKSFRGRGSAKSKTHIVKSINHVRIMVTIGFASQAREKNERIHKSFHTYPKKVSHWAFCYVVCKKVVTFIIAAETIAISGNYLYHLNVPRDLSMKFVSFNCSVPQGTAFFQFNSHDLLRALSWRSACTNQPIKSLFILTPPGS